LGEVQRLFDTGSGHWREAHGPNVVPIATRWSVAGQRLVVGTTAMGDQRAQAYLWDTARPALIGTLAGHTAEIRATAFSGDGQRLALADAGGVASVHEATSGTVLQRWTLRGTVEALALDTAGHRLAGADGQGEPSLWDTATGRFVSTLDTLGAEPAPGATLRRQAALAAFSADSRWLLTASGWAQPMPAEAASGSGSGQMSSLRLEAGLRLWDAATGAPVRRIDRLACQWRLSSPAPMAHAWPWACEGAASLSTPCPRPD
jgi:WD40 repeat protein